MFFKFVSTCADYKLRGVDAWHVQHVQLVLILQFKSKYIEKALLNQRRKTLLH